LNRAVFSTGQEGMGQVRSTKRGTNFNTTNVIFFTKYEKYIEKIISFANVMDTFASIRARKVPL
jgi:hypothetical protein